MLLEYVAFDKISNLWISCTPNKEVDLVDDIMEHILFYRLKKSNEAENSNSFHMENISESLSKLADNISFSVGSEEYNQAKRNYENNIK